eukprot:1357247-Amorphochlora_amoeboformis.AAC.1
MHSRARNIFRDLIVRIENVLQKVARGVLSSQVPDASPVSISSGGISLTTQIRDSTTVLG